MDVGDEFWPEPSLDSLFPISKSVLVCYIFIDFAQTKTDFEIGKRESKLGSGQNSSPTSITNLRI